MDLHTLSCMISASFGGYSGKYIFADTFFPPKRSLSYQHESATAAAADATTTIL